MLLVFLACFEDCAHRTDRPLAHFRPAAFRTWSRVRFPTAQDEPAAGSRRALHAGAGMMQHRACSAMAATPDILRRPGVAP